MASPEPSFTRMEGLPSFLIKSCTRSWIKFQKSYKGYYRSRRSRKGHRTPIAPHVKFVPRIRPFNFSKVILSNFQCDCVILQGWYKLAFTLTATSLAIVMILVWTIISGHTQREGEGISVALVRNVLCSKIVRHVPKGDCYPKIQYGRSCPVTQRPQMCPTYCKSKCMCPHPSGRKSLSVKFVVSVFTCISS